MVEVDGTVFCDRCEVGVAGHGVLYGLIASTAASSGQAVDRIFCYINGCREVALAGMILIPPPPDAGLGGQVCTYCGTGLAAWTPALAMLCADLDPDDPGIMRRMAFCYAEGCAATLLLQVGITA